MFDDFEEGEPEEKIILEYQDVLEESDKAWYVRFGLFRFCWLPKSQCDISTTDSTIEVPLWLVDQEDLHDFASGEGDEA